MANTIVSFDVEYKPWLAAATDNYRPSLTGVFVDPVGPKLVAADGFMLAAVPCKVTGKNPGVIVPTLFLKNLHSKRVKNAVELTFAVDLRTATVIGETKEGTIGGKLIDGKFPDWRPLVPRVKNGAEGYGDLPDGQASYDPKMMVSLAQAIGSEWCDVQYTQGRTTPILLAGQGGALGVQMPVFMQPTDFKKLVAEVVG